MPIPDSRLVTCGILFAILSVVSIWHRSAAADQVTLEFETQALDLDGGTIIKRLPVDLPETDGADLRLRYHADRVPHCVVVPAGKDVEIAHLDGVAFEYLDAVVAAGLAYTAEAPDVPFDSTDTLVVRTDTGALSRVGRAVESEAGVTLDYERLQ